MKSNTHKFDLYEKVSVFDQDGIITEIIEESKAPYLYEVTFDKTQKHYIIEAGHIEHWKDPRPVTERIKTFEDACIELGKDNVLVRQYKLYNEQMDGNVEDMADISAFLKLRIIAAALNEGWKPEYTEDERRWYPWHYLYTQDEIDNMSQDEKERISLVLWGGSANYGSCCGLGYAYSLYAFSNSDSYYG
ncbi:MAG: hypothetical protein NC548_52405, partial [Lachnospiraceae bacterium]|nr:hypothetical protein [Lachnospiraceae bacterium]